MSGLKYVLIPEEIAWFWRRALVDKHIPFAFPDREGEYVYECDSDDRRWVMSGHPHVRAAFIAAAAKVLHDE